MKKVIMSSLLMMLCIVTSCLAAPADIPALNERVVDATNTLTKEQKASLNQKSDILDKMTGTVAIALMVNSAGEEGIDDYAQRVAETYHPGHAGDDRGVVLVIAKNDKKWAIRTTRNTGQTLTDVQSKQVLNKMGAYVKEHKGDFAGAMTVYFASIEPFIQRPVVPDAPVATVTPVVEEDHTVAYVASGALALILAGLGIAYWVRVQREEAERLEAERQEALREYESRQERERQRQRERIAEHEANKKNHVANGVVAGAAIAYTASSYTTPKQTPKKQAPVSKPAAKRSDDYTPVIVPVPVSTSSWSSRDDDSSSSRSSWSDSSPSSSSSSYDSSSSSSSYDGGGSSSSFD